MSFLEKKMAKKERKEKIPRLKIKQNVRVKGTLTERQHHCISLLLTTNLKKQEIAERLGVSPQTISYWLKEPDFKIALAKASQELEDIYRYERIQAARQIAQNGLEELLKRFERGKIKGEKTKTIVEVIQKIYDMMRTDMGLKTIGRPKQNQDEIDPITVGTSGDTSLGVDMNNADFRSGLKQLIKRTSS